ncbi:hypothetical protein NL676_008831 [Syzygium grande]|nr:hypothetical protein NL676_008831 [Syzygium grande]
MAHNWEQQDNLRAQAANALEEQQPDAANAQDVQAQATAIVNAQDVQTQAAGQQLDIANARHVQVDLRVADGQAPAKPYRWTILGRYTIYCLTVLLLLMFTGVMLYGCYQIECRH